jgi:hypothetical protein
LATIIIALILIVRSQIDKALKDPIEADKNPIDKVTHEILIYIHWVKLSNNRGMISKVEVPLEAQVLIIKDQRTKRIGTPREGDNIEGGREDTQRNILSITREHGEQ